MRRKNQGKVIFQNRTGKQKISRQIRHIHPKLLDSLTGSEFCEIDNLATDFVSFTKESGFCETESLPRVGFAELSETESLPELGFRVFSFNIERLPEDVLLDSDCTLRCLLPTA